MSVHAEIPIELVNIVPLSLSAVVKGRTGDESWKEIADVISVSSTGAGFHLTRECKVGRLVSLIMPLEPELRCYDHDKELYSVWGLVQHCHMVPVEEESVYHVGVAFIGKHAPTSYRDDPMRSYRISGMNEDGFWKISEAGNDFKSRKDPRFYKAIDLYLALVDAQKSSVAGERTVTENISRGGAAVISNLDVNVGDRVKFISEEYNFGLAVVCNRHTGSDKRTRLHLQFVENTFPIETIRQPK